MWYFQRNGFIFKVKILKEVRFSESLLILLEIRFVWNNGGQKHSLRIDVRCAVSASFFFAVQNWLVSCVHYPDKIYFISITLLYLKLRVYDIIANVILLNSLWKFSSLIQRRLDFVCTASFAWLHFLYITGNDGVSPGILILSPVVTARMGLQRQCCQLSRIIRETPDFEPFLNRSPD